MEEKSLDGDMERYEKDEKKKWKQIGWMKLGKEVILGEGMEIVMVMQEMEVKKGKKQMGDLVLINEILMKI